MKRTSGNTQKKPGWLIVRSPSPVRIPLASRPLFILLPTQYPSSAITTSDSHNTPSRHHPYLPPSPAPSPSQLHRRGKNLLIIHTLQRIPRQATNHQPRNRRPNTPLPIPLRRLLRDNSASHSANHARPDATVRSGKMLLRLVESIRRFRAGRILAGALLGRVARRALVFGGGARAAGVIVAGSAMMVVTGPGLVVVASGDAAVGAVAHVRRGRVIAVVGVLGLVSCSTVSGVEAMGLLLAVVRVRHAMRIALFGWDGVEVALLSFSLKIPCWRRRNRKDEQRLKMEWTGKTLCLRDLKE